jgi:hypothetical protein
MQPAINAANIAKASAAPTRDIKEAFIYQYLMICPKKMSLQYGQGKVG